MKLLYTYHQLNSHSQRFIKTFTSFLGKDFDHCLYESLPEKAEQHFDLLLFGPIHLWLDESVARKFKKVVGIAWAWEVWLAAYEDHSQQKAIKHNIPLFDALVVDADYVKEVVEELTHLKIKNSFMLPWGLDLERFESLPREAAKEKRLEKNWQDKVVYISTRPWEKNFGIKNLVESFILYFEKNPKAVLVLANSGPLENWLASKNLKDRLFLLGKTSEIPLWLSLADYYVSSAPTDGTSLSLLEGMACGKRPLVQNFGSNKQWIEGDEEGLLLDFSKPQEAAERLFSDFQAHPPVFESGLREKVFSRADWSKNSSSLFQYLKSLF